MFKETQKITELRNTLISFVKKTEDVDDLKKIEAVYKKSKKNAKEDWWDELPVEQQTRIAKALKNAKAGKNLVTHESVSSRAKKRIKARRVK